MIIANVHEAKTQLSKLLEAVERGEEVIIARAGKAVAKLVPADPPKRPRPRGVLAGQVTYDPVAWAEGDAEILKDFEDSLNKPFD